MYQYFDNKLQKNSVNLAPGEFFVSGDDIIINTVLGSCVAVVLYDPKLKIAGLNHFMLAEAKHIQPGDNVFNIERYGLYAMEALLNGLMKLGSRRNQLQAKVFGGSSVLERIDNSRIDVGADNIRFAEQYLETENIPIISRDTGGVQARRIYLFPQTFRILLRRIKPSEELKTMMKEYKKDLEERKKDDGKTVIF